MDVAEVIPAIFNEEWKKSRRFIDSSFSMWSGDFTLRIDDGRRNLERKDDEGNAVNE